MFWRYLEEAFKDLELHQNIIPALGLLKEKGIKLVIISASNSEKIKMHIKPLEISHYFDFILGRNDVKNPKPHPEIAEKAMKIFKVKPKETLLVGDTDIDVETGKNAGARTALFMPEANRPFAEFAHYRKTKPDFEFQNFSELPEKLKSLL